jgi:hypothetical protein
MNQQTQKVEQPTKKTVRSPEFRRLEQQHLTAAMYGSPLMVRYIFIDVCKDLVAASLLANIYEPLAEKNPHADDGEFKLNLNQLRKVAGLNLNELLHGLVKLRNIKILSIPRDFSSVDLANEHFELAMSINHQVFSNLFADEVEKKIMDDMANVRNPSASRH